MILSHRVICCDDLVRIQRLVDDECGSMVLGFSAYRACDFVHHLRVGMLSWIARKKSSRHRVGRQNPLVIWNHDTEHKSSPSRRKKNVFEISSNPLRNAPCGG